MTDRDLARKLLAELRRLPSATPAEALAKFRHLLVEVELTGRNARKP